MLSWVNGTAQSSNSEPASVLYDCIVDCSTLTEWSGAWHLFGLLNSLQINIQQIYPCEDNNFESVYSNRLLEPRNDIIPQCKYFSF